MKNFIKYLFLLTVLPVCCIACEEEGTGWNPSMIPDDPELPQPGQNADRKAPLYWSVYEYAYESEETLRDPETGIVMGSIDIAEGEWNRIIDWVAENLKPYGYDMICTDGFMAMTADTSLDASGYMTTYGSMPLKTLIAKAKAKGLKIGIYDNPLWLHGPDETLVEGTNINFGSLRYNDALDRDVVLYPGADDVFGWVVPSHRGAREYIDGFFKYYKSIGVEFIRMDFLCLFERANGAGSMSGKGYGRENYKLALQYINESASKYGVFTSLVMPNMDNDAELEAMYGDMARIVADTFHGGWDHVSGRERGRVYDGWPCCHNQFDGYVHWSHLSGRDKIILDGDFQRLNTLASDAECEFVISLNLLAGGPVAVADQYNTIGDRLKFYQNEEMLALNADRFVGKPLGDRSNLWDEENQIWYGQMSDGSWIVGLFNRENDARTRSVDFSRLGIGGRMKVRDLWKHADEGEADRLNVRLEPHSCKIVKLTPAE